MNIELDLEEPEQLIDTQEKEEDRCAYCSKLLLGPAVSFPPLATLSKFFCNPECLEFYIQSK
jgi:hypothetical protein